MITTHPVVFEALWKVDQAAAFLQVSKSWCYEAAAAGVMPSLKIGGLLRFDPAAVRAWALGAPAQVLQLKAKK